MFPSDAINQKVIDAFSVSKTAINTYEAFFEEKINSRIKLKYLSHLVTSIEDLINEKESLNISAR
jgi:hypothetical protein